MIMRYNRRQFLKLTRLFSSAVGLSAIMSGCDRPAWWSGAAPSAQPLKIGYLPITDAAPLLAAYDKGFYRAEGLTPEPPQQYRSWDAIIDAFISREVNVIHLLMPTTMLVRYGFNFPGKVVAWNHTNGSALTVRPDLEQPAHLAGTTLAIPSWYSIHNVVLQILLRAQGLKPTSKPSHTALETNEVRLVVLPPSDMLKALIQQDIAGYMVAEPYNSAAETQGLGKILRLTGDVWKDHACCVVFMHEADLQHRPQWTQKVVNAIVKSQLWARANRPELAHILSLDGGKYIPYPVSILDRVLNSYDQDYYTRQKAILHPQWRSQRIDFQPYPFPSYTHALAQELKQTFIQDEIQFLDKLSPDQVVSDLVDDSFVRLAMRKLGGGQSFGLPIELSRHEVLET
ncbi:MAG: ABC transporter substrate-binding protein [Spirulina sp. SIO3F2]|nr:ABC transporter substrate-binding protein [Spirulina sp. SIO3F2]